MIVLLQALTALYALAFAWHNAVPVRKMIRYGAERWEEREFHQAGACVRLLWAVTLAALTGETFWQAAGFCLLLLLIQWLVFDIALNLFIGHNWDYLGNTAWLDRTVKNGKLKAVVILSIIIILNIIL